MTVSLEPGLIETHHTQLTERGHVYVPQVYDPSIGRQLDAELGEIFRYTPARSLNLGEQLRNSESAKPDSRHPNLMYVLGAIGTLASTVFGQELWPPQPGTRQLLQTIDMIPVVRTTVTGESEVIHRTAPVYGSWHQDRTDIKGLVAITTYMGSSGLEVEDGVTHDLLPGGVVLLDNDRALFHRGFSNVKRQALGLANISGK